MAKHHNPRSAVIAALLPLLAGSAAAATCEWASPAHRQALLELYTSEGCNSCPPADLWLSRLREEARPGPWVPLAFHVDYWNQLGWRDRFSHAQYTRRQQAAAERNRAGFVYTPQFLLDGRDIRPLRQPEDFHGRLARLSAQPAQAHIRAQARREADGALRVSGESRLAVAGTGADTYIAVYENGLVSQVARGENAGRTLRHDYVVRALAGPLPSDTQGVNRFDQRIDLPSEANSARLGVAVFTQMRASGDVLQAAAVEGCLSDTGPASVR